MSSLDVDLGKIQEAADLDMNAIAAESTEAARVRATRSGESNKASKLGDNAGSLLSDLFSESDAEAEVASRLAKKRAAENKKRAEDAERAEKARLEAEKRLEEEKKRMAEMEARKAKMIADMEKQRRIEELGYDEEEVARQKAEEEARIRAEEEAEAREIEENERLIAELKANQAELDAKNKAAAAKKAEEERIAQRQKTIRTSIIAVIVVCIAGALTFYFATKKAPDFYVLNKDYPTMTLNLTSIPAAGMTKDAIAKSMVEQAAPKAARTHSTGTSSNKPAKNVWGVESQGPTNVFNTSKK